MRESPNYFIAWRWSEKNAILIWCLDFVIVCLTELLIESRQTVLRYYTHVKPWPWQCRNDFLEKNISFKKNTRAFGLSIFSIYFLYGFVEDLLERCRFKALCWTQECQGASHGARANRTTAQKGHYAACPKCSKMELEGFRMFRMFRVCEDVWVI